MLTPEPTVRVLATESWLIVPQTCFSFIDEFAESKGAQPRRPAKALRSWVGCRLNLPAHGVFHKTAFYVLQDSSHKLVCFLFCILDKHPLPHFLNYPSQTKVRLCHNDMNIRCSICDIQYFLLALNTVMGHVRMFQYWRMDHIWQNFLRIIWPRDAVFVHESMFYGTH